MTAQQKCRELLLRGALAASVAACGTLGTDPGENGPLPHNGTGPYRILENAETGATGSPAGRVVTVARGAAVDRGMIAGGHLFFAAAAPRADAPAQDPVPADVDWSLFDARTITRAPRATAQGFAAGTVVLEATGDEGFMTDPWVLLLPNGRARMYFASERGIGAAEAPSVDGTFTRVGADGVVLAAGAGESLRRPSAVVLGGRTLLYVDDGAGIDVADAADGLAFGARTPIALEGGLDAGMPETRLGSPAAALATSRIGHTFVRFFAESILADGSRTVVLLGSADGMRFERYGLPVVTEDGAGAPAPLVLDGRTTLLVLTLPAEASDRQVRALVAGVSPGGTTF